MVIAVLSTFSVFYYIFKRDRPSLRALVCTVFAAVLIAGPYILMVLNKILPIRNPVYLSPFTLASFYPLRILNNGLVVFMPSQGLWQDPLRVMSYISLPLLIYYSIKRKLWSIFLFSVLILPAAVLLNPFLLTWCRSFNPGMERLYLLALITPSVYVSSAVGYRIVIFLLKQTGKIALLKALERHLLAIVFLFMISVIFYGSFKILTGVPDTRDYNLLLINRYFSPRLVGFVRENIPPASVIVSDKFTSMSLPVYFPDYVVVIAKYRHMEPNIDPIPRIKDMDRFFSRPLSEEDFEILKRYDADYVMVNKRLSHKRLEGHSAFKRLFEDSLYVIYKYLG
jgi:hypothetical protein